ncbi:MAG: hypothetical protein U0325_33025 [Polyangiales bacterium]
MRHEPGDANIPSTRAAGRSGHDDEIAARVRQAWGAVVALASVLVGALGAGTTLGAGGARLSTATVVAAMGVTAATAVVAVIVAGRPLRERTGFDVDFMVSRVWLPGMLGLLFPPVALIEACLRLASRSVGGYQTTRENGVGGRAYPEVALPLGEGRPLGVILLLVATAWPALVYMLLRGSIVTA